MLKQTLLEFFFAGVLLNLRRRWLLFVSSHCILHHLFSFVSGSGVAYLGRTPFISVHLLYLILCTFVEIGFKI